MTPDSARDPAAHSGRARGRHRAGSTMAVARGPHRALLLTARVLMTIISVMVLVATGSAWTIKARADITLQARTISAVLVDDPHIATPTVATGPAASIPDERTTYQAENILLLGSDSHRRRKADSTAPPGQSDTLMIAHLSADRQRIDVLSVPRDVQVAAPTCQQWSDGIVVDSVQPTDPGEIWKITNAYAVGGPACTVRAVQQVTGIRIDRVVVIDLNGFRDMVNAVGGIEVDFCGPIIDGELKTVIATSGRHLLDGDAALNVVRARKVEGDPTGDLGRIRRQQIVLSALVGQLTSAGTLLNPTRVDSILQALLSNTYTDNVSFDDLIGLAQSLNGVRAGAVTFLTVPTAVSADDPDALVLGESARAIFDAVINDQPVPRHRAAATATAEKIPPSTTAPAAPIDRAESAVRADERLCA